VWIGWGLWITSAPGSGFRESARVSKSADHLNALIREHGGVITTAEAHGAGLTQASLRWGVHKGLLQPLRRGVYTSSSLWHRASPEARHLLRILAQQREHPELVACAASAAIALDLPTPSGPPTRPRLTVSRDPQERGARGDRGGALGRRSWLADEEITTLSSGIVVTTPVRTVLDCARDWDGPWGLAIADAALAASRVSAAALVTAARERVPAPGTRRARWAAEHARAGVESPLESLARAVVMLAGLPEPTPQVWLTTRTGRFRVDLLDAENRLIIEADGRLKYTCPEDLWREKLREDALRDSGFEVVRFTINDYRNQPPWLRTYNQALARARAARRRRG
jgi:predicted transcriptional regulator of viral defense system